MWYDFPRGNKNLLVLHFREISQTNHRPLFNVNEGNKPEEKMAVQSQA